MDNVRILRESRGWTQQHLADASGLSLRTVQRVEAGEVAPSRETLLALSGTFGVRISEDNGPHIVLRAGDDFLPGCCVDVVKDNYLVALACEVDSRARTAKRWGMLLMDFDLEHATVEAVADARRTVLRTVDGRRIEIENDGGHVTTRVDGEVWDGRDHPVTFVYDAVLVRGPASVLREAREEGKIPKHWVMLSEGS